MVAAIDLAMGIVQLTAVLIPLLLGLTQYYANNENRIGISDSTLRRYMGLLFLPLFLAYVHSFAIINAFGNPHLSTAVVAYGAFLTCLYSAIPYMLDQKQWAYLFSAMGIGFLVITLYLTGIVFLGRLGSVSIIVVLLLGTVAFYLTKRSSDRTEGGV